MSKRDIESVIGDILGLLPAEEHALAFEFMAIRSSAIYTAPESMGVRWRDGHQVLAGRFGVVADFDALPQWAQSVLVAWSGRTPDELREACKKQKEDQA